MLALRFGIVDIGMGNLHSVLSAMKQIGVEATTVNSADQIGAYTHLILPGVGSFRQASSRLE